MSSTNSDGLTSLFLVWMPFMSFSCLIVFAKTSNVITVAIVDCLAFFLILDGRFLVFHHEYNVDWVPPSLTVFFIVLILWAPWLKMKFLLSSFLKILLQYWIALYIAVEKSDDNLIFFLNNLIFLHRDPENFSFVFTFTFKPKSFTRLCLWIDSSKSFFTSTWRTLSTYRFWLSLLPRSSQF